MHIASQVTFSIPFGGIGYRTDCRNVPFNDVLTVNHDGSGQPKAWFKQTSRTQFKLASTNYFTTGPAYGLWSGYGVAPTSYQYQLGICDSSSTLAPGIWMSGYTGCWKECNSWCGDTSTAWFRAESETTCYAGVAWNENGHNECNNNVSKKRASFGIRRSV